MHPKELMSLYFDQIVPARADLGQYLTQHHLLGNITRWGDHFIPVEVPEEFTGLQIYFVSHPKFYREVLYDEICTIAQQHKLQPRKHMASWEPELGLEFTQLAFLAFSYRFNIVERDILKKVAQFYEGWEARNNAS